MTPSEIDANSFGKEEYGFSGNYRAIVEDNEDPLRIGRVKVRILGIHSLDPVETPVSHLPWAEPCLNMYYSGGKNLENKSGKDDDRYKPNAGSNFIPPSRMSDELTASFVDPIQENSGTGGIYTTPRKGSQVWIFFENNDHTRPQYWSMAPKKEDWDIQKTKLVSEIRIKKENVKFWQDDINPLIDTALHVGKETPTKNAKVKTINEKPKIEIFNIDDIENYYITSYTSPGGITHIIVNKDNLEKHYIIHKGTIEYVEHNGQRKIMIGNNEFRDKNNSGKANDLEHLVANNYELHIGGDFEIFVKKSKSIQVEGDYQINANKNVGIVSRSGNVNIVVENGDVNVDTKNNINLTVGGNLQAHVKKDILAKVDGKSTLEINGKTSIKCKSDISIESGGSVSIKAKDSINLEAKGINSISSSETSFKCTQYSITCEPAGFHVAAGSTFRIDQAGFGGDKMCSAQIVNARHPGAFPGPIAGFAAPYPGTPLSPSPAKLPDPLQFENGNETLLEDPNPPAYDEKQTNTVYTPLAQQPQPKNDTFLGREI